MQTINNIQKWTLVNNSSAGNTDIIVFVPNSIVP